MALGLPLGPRRKLLKAIARLREGAPPSPAAGEIPEVPASASPSQAERRQLTESFGRYMSAIYADRFDSYAGPLVSG